MTADSIRSNPPEIMPAVSCSPKSPTPNKIDTKENDMIPKIEYLPASRFSRALAKKRYAKPVPTTPRRATHKDVSQQMDVFKS